jgi:hypothetical protein
VVSLETMSDNFYTTRAGDSIGITDEMINTDITHMQFGNVDTSIFKVFERTKERTPDGQSNLTITIGFNGRIQDTIFIPDTVNTVQRPQSDIPSGLFDDSVCVEFSTSTDSATLSYSLDGTPPATSPLSLKNPGRLCFRETTTIRLIGKRTGWKNSPEVSFTYTRKAQPLPSEFSKLTPVAGKETRYMRLLWNGRTRDGSRAGNGVYIFKTAITLLPGPGVAKTLVSATTSRRIGILRSPE